MKVKICGITSLEDARMVVDNGADALGFIIDVPVSTPRKISLEEACRIVDELGKLEQKVVAVMMNPKPKQVEEVYEALTPDAFQFHGSEKPLLLAQVKDILDVELIKTIHIGEDGAVQWDYGNEIVGLVDYLLLDTRAGDMAGGTGRTHDWNVSVELKENTGKRIILSGGLNKDNVVDAVKKVNPNWVDVSSGVESEPGRKDAVKVREFMEALKNAR
ncbi:MAG: phosphoribosylanthranilate isomerase [Candidatus Altiarchaeota archaeon]|nr:phosphoribosylanthranilate isomerase [Candidatus Altiarchaeota archaeon]